MNTLDQTRKSDADKMKKNFDSEQHLKTMAKAMALDIDPAWRPMVLLHLENAANMVKILNDVPMKTNEFHLAACFNPGQPRPQED